MMDVLKAFVLELIPEGVEPLVFAVQFVFAIVGATSLLISDVGNRDITGEKKPVKFSFAFLIKDNFSRIAGGAGAMWLILYFIDLALEPDSPKMVRYAFSAAAGLCSDFILSRLIKGVRTKARLQLDKWFPKPPAKQ